MAILLSNWEIAYIIYNCNTKGSEAATTCHSIAVYLFLVAQQQADRYVAHCETKPACVAALLSAAGSVTSSDSDQIAKSVVEAEAIALTDEIAIRSERTDAPNDSVQITVDMIVPFRRLLTIPIRFVGMWEPKNEPSYSSVFILKGFDSYIDINAAIRNQR